MGSMTDAEILSVARTAVPDHIKPLGRIAVRHDVAPAGLRTAKGPSEQDQLIADLIDRVGAKPAKAAKSAPDSADVEFPEQTALGLKTTVVHVRNGKVERVLKRG